MNVTISFSSTKTQLTVFLICFFLLLAFPSSLLAAPVAPLPVTLIQPDGTPFEAMPYGDEWSNGYEVQGYTILQNEKSGYWHYATVENGRFALTSSRVGEAIPKTLTPHLRAEPQLAHKIQLATTQQAWSGTSGSHPVLVILADFTPSASVGTTAVQWHDLFFNDGNGAKSVKNYYEQASYGNLTIQPASESQETANDGIIAVTLGYAHPNTRGSVGTDNVQLVRDALIAADSFIDFSSFDSNGNNALDNTELHLVVIPRGFETAVGGTSSACVPSVWGHQLSISGAVSAPLLDGVLVGDTSSGGSYLQFGEWHETRGNGCRGNQGNLATIGPMVHEFGHDLNWPDLYDTDGSSFGVGSWSIMGAGGSWAYVNSEPLGTTPVLPDPFSKIYQGWLAPTQISTYTPNVSIPNSAENGVVYQLLDNPNGVDWSFGDSSGVGEYFLIENRQQVGFDAGLDRISSSAGGCLIWHIDESVNHTNLNNNDEDHKHVDVEEADGAQDMDISANRGDSGDPWPGSSNATAFTPSSVPNSRLYDGSDSGVRVTNISAGSTGCQVDLMAAPNINVVETAVSSPQITNSQQSQTLTIENSGTYALTWAIHEDSMAKTQRRATTTLYDNGPLVNSPGTGSGGADESLSQASTFNMTTLGFNNAAPSERVADQFTITDAGGWQIDTITFYSFQPNSTTTSNINGLNLRIWDGPPNNPGSSIVFGDTITNRLDSSSWANIYRAFNVLSGNTSRPVMANVATVNTTLMAGTYWLDWQTSASSGSNPDVPPITINGQTTTGDALGSSNNGTSWSNLMDTGSQTQQGLPFVIRGSIVEMACSSPNNISWLDVSIAAGTTAVNDSTQLDLTFDSSGLANGSYDGTLCVTSDDLNSPLIQVPVTMNVCAEPTTATITNIAVVDNTDIQLTWLDEGAVQYEVWTMANAPYTPPDVPCETTDSCTLVSGLSWTHEDALVNAAGMVNYVVKTAVSCGDSFLTAPPSNAKATHSFSIVPGS